MKYLWCKTEVDKPKSSIKKKKTKKERKKERKGKIIQSTMEVSKWVV